VRRGLLRRPLAALLIAAATLLLFAPVATHEFLLYDDDRYVTANPVVLAGLTARGVAWAMTSFAAANWHPLAWLSHMADVSLFGVRPGAHHLVSLGLHAASAAALALVLDAMTGALLPSVAVAALFALHPLHVEPVAWIAERKELLAGLFWWLTLGAYLRYARRPGAGRYAAVAALFALGLMAKPTIVTLPLVLMLLDFWPLGRLAPPGGGRGAAGAGALLREKLPLLALAAGCAVLTILAQSAGGGLKTLAAYPLGVRAANALTGCLWYLEKLFWPAGLAVFYPHPRAPIAAVPVVTAALALAALTGAAIAQRRARPWLLTGWLWYLATLLPVIGLVQVGGQAVADRYSYVPLTGAGMALAWLAAGPRRGSAPRRAAAGAALLAVSLAAAAVAARHQLSFWHDGVTLFGRAVRTTPANAVAYTQLGVACARAGRLVEAREALEASVRINPLFAESRYDLGLVEARLGRFADAAAQYRLAVALDPAKVNARWNLGLVAITLRDREAALEQQRALAALDPAAARDLGRMIRTVFP
jgi:tetratricopeptide (TPR) repeat protein